MRFWPFLHINSHTNSEKGSVKYERLSPHLIQHDKQLIAIELPAPNKTGGMTLSEALCNRRSVRNISSERISNQQLSDLLWSACGINGERKNGARVDYLHTNPTACNHQEVMVYVLMKEGVYLYDSINNCLRQILSKDIRSKLSKLSFVRNAAISLCLVSDLSMMNRFDDKYRMDMYSPMDVGYVSENIYLHCAANSLSTCACGLINRERISKIMGLANAKVLLVHPIGIRK